MFCRTDNTGHYFGVHVQFAGERQDHCDLGTNLRALYAECALHSTVPHESPQGSIPTPKRVSPPCVHCFLHLIFKPIANLNLKVISPFYVHLLYMYFIAMVYFLGIWNYLKKNKCTLMFSRPQIKIFIEGLFSFDQDIAAFKEHLRDFLVQIRVRIHLNWNFKCTVNYIYFLKFWYTWQITTIAFKTNELIFRYLWFVESLQCISTCTL